MTTSLRTTTGERTNLFCRACGSLRRWRIAFVVIGIALCSHGLVARAEQPYFAGWGANVPKEDIRAGGVLDVSYNYHKNPTEGAAVGAEILSPSPWYGWGFPVQTYRWGWFGAQRYYPRVFWHHGYHGDCCRHAYRYGY